MLIAVISSAPRTSWRSLAGCVGSALVLAACLDPNPEFGGASSSSSSSSSSGPGAGTTEASEGSSTGPVTCEDDGYEPLPDATTSDIPALGEYSMVLVTTDAIDSYVLYRPPEAPDRIYVSTDPGLRVCVYLRCDGSEFTCPPDAVSSQIPDALADGCCADGELDLTYTCMGDGSEKIQIDVAEAPADCTFYSLVLAEAPP